MSNYKIMFRSSRVVATIFGLAAALPAFAGVSVSSPGNNSSVGSSFTLSANTDSCSGQGISAMGYSFDNSSNTTIVYSSSINTQVQAPGSAQVLHVKAWGNQGSSCVTDVAISVNGGGGGNAANSQGGGSALSVVPSWATQTGGIQTFGNWQNAHDEGTPGWSSGAMSIQGWPSVSGSARLFENTFNYYGGERYWIAYDDDKYSQNFFYDTWVYIADNASGVANMEFDLNQTMPNGQTVIMGFQCDGWNNTWDYTANGSSPDSPWDMWIHSNAYCNPQSWGGNQWHHLQIFYSHDESGWVQYHTVWLDGNRQDINANVFSGFSLGWGPAIVTNFQLDGDSGGTTWANIYLDAMTVYRW